MSDVEDSHLNSDRTNNEVEDQEVTNEQYKPLRPGDQNYAQLIKRLKLDDPWPCQLVLLNEDILHHLFSSFNILELVKMSHVCKAWQIVSRQKIKFVSTVSFYDPVPEIHDPDHVGSMNISLMKNLLELTDKTVTQVYIKGLYQEGVGSSGRIINPEILSDNCPNLTRLSLNSIEMSQTFCSNLGRCLPQNLKTLEIKLCFELEDQDFYNILGSCKNLENLEIYCAVLFTGLSIIEKLQNGQLKKLSLVDCPDIDDVHLFRILEMFKSSLRELSLQCMAAEEHLLGMNANNLVHFKFHLLETLSIKAYQAMELNDPINEPTKLYYNLKLFLDAMPNLHTLKLQDCQFTANKQCYFKLLPKSVPLLKELHIVNSLPVYRKGIYFLSDLENLETLVLKGLFDMYDKNYDSDDNDDDFDLLYFDKVYCHSLPDQAKEVIIKHLVSVIIKCPKLKTIVFDDMPMVNDDHVFTMISSMPSLRLLDVNMNCMITGSFVSKCADLDRMEHIKVKLNGHEVKIDSLPTIPSFLELCLECPVP